MSGPMTIDRAHGLVCRRGPALRRARLFGRQHVVKLGDLEIMVGDDRVVHLRALRLLDVGEPARMGLARVDAQADELGVALGELRLDLGHVAEFGRADRGEVLGMGKQDRPLVADPLVKVDLALRCFGGEVGSSVVEAKGHQKLLWKIGSRQCEHGLRQGRRRGKERRRSPRCHDPRSWRNADRSPRI